MVDFVVDGVTQTLTTTERLWEGGRGSFVVNGTGFTDATLQADFLSGAGAQALDGALTVTATGVVNFELPRGCLVSVVLTVGGGSFEHVGARRITEVGAT